MRCKEQIGTMQVILGLALRAKQATPDEDSLRLAMAAAAKTFCADDPLRLALDDFAAGFACARRNPDHLREAGQMLFAAVRRASWPSTTARTDIEG